MRRFSGLAAGGPWHRLGSRPFLCHGRSFVPGSDQGSQPQLSGIQGSRGDVHKTSSTDQTLARAEASSLLLSVPRGGPRLDIPGGLVCLSPSLRQWMCGASSSGLSPGPLHGHLPLLASSGGCPHGLAHSLGYLLRLEPKLEEGGSCGFYVSSNSSKLECFPRAE